MQTIFGVVLPAPVLWVLALLFVLALVAVFGLILRRIGGRRATLKGQGGARARQPRLGVIDIYDLDRQRQLVLLRRDNVEHLVMIGGPTDVVVESSIMRAGARAVPPPAQDGTALDRAETEAAYMPAMPLPGAAAAPVTGLAASQPMAPPPLPTAAPTPPVSPAPSVIPAPAPLSQAMGPSHAPAPAASAAPMAAPVPSVPAGDAVLAGGIAAGVAAGAAAAVLRGEANAAAASAPAADMAGAGMVRSKANIQAEPAAPGFQAPAFPLESAPPPRPPAADLDDMARQLEQALKRPFAAVRSSAPAAGMSTQVNAPVNSPPETAEAHARDDDGPKDLAAPKEPPAPQMGAAEEKAPDRPAAIESPARQPDRDTAKAVSEPGRPTTPLASDFAALMDEQLKAVVEAKATAPAKPVADAGAKAIAGLGAAASAIDAELQAAMAETFASHLPARTAASAPPRNEEAPPAAASPAQATDSAKPAPAAGPGRSADGPPAEAGRNPAEPPASAAKGKDAGAAAPGTRQPAGTAGTAGADAPPAPGRAGPADPAEADPFSIDAIEMEFARLLGRDTKPKT